MQVREIIMITNAWNKTEGESISQKVMGKVRSDAPLKNRINFAQKQLEVQITKLTGINEKLQTKHDKIFEKVDRDKAKTITKINIASPNQPPSVYPGISTPKVAIVDIARNTAKIGSPLTTKSNNDVQAVIQK